jgi:hypothetical protein
MAKDFLWGEEFKLDVARGKARGAEVRNIFGQNDAQTTTFRAVWEKSNDTDYVFPSTAQIMRVASDDVLDANVQILIKGLDADYLEISEVVTLTDTTTVPGSVLKDTTQQFFRINDVVTVGTQNLLTTSTLTVQDTAQTTVFAQIDNGHGRNQAAIYTVPANCEFYLYRLDGFTADDAQQSPSQKAAKFRNVVTLNPSGIILRVATTEFFNQMNIQRRFPFKYSGKTDIQLQMATFNGTHPVSIFGEGILVKEIM